MLTVTAANFRVLQRRIGSEDPTFSTRFSPCAVNSGNYEGNWETENHDHYDESDDPVWDREKWKNLGGDLDEEPSNNGVCDSDLVDMAPLQLAKNGL